MSQKINNIQLKHPSGINQTITDILVARRGHLHAFPTLDPTKTALLIIDLDIGTGRDYGTEHINKTANAINSLASTLREQGGSVFWVTTPIQKATYNFRAIFGDELTKAYERGGTSGESDTVWPELVVDKNDLKSTKQGHSALFPGKSDLHEQLQARGIKSILIAGADTNICCEATARDGAELQYQITMVSDALVGWSKEQDQATFATIARCYGDVRPSEEIMQLTAN